MGILFVVFPLDVVSWQHREFVGECCCTPDNKVRWRSHATLSLRCDILKTCKGTMVESVLLTA